ncbi:MAG: flavodoxin [Actinomycetales bacterium]
MNVLVVVESMFGNTRVIAEEIAVGLREVRPEGTVRVVPVTEPVPPLDAVSGLLVGGPTHAFSMSRTSTREDAAHQGAEGQTGRGLREWVTEAGKSASGFTGAIVTFDTRIPRFPGSAAASAAKALRRAGFSRAERGESFWVSGKTGPLADGELERAREWGRTLAATLAE